MLGALTLGWPWWVGWLPAELGVTEPLPPLLSPTGGLAFILGATGFLVTTWYVLRPQTVLVARPTSYLPDRWVRVIADGAYAVSGALSRVQSGLLATYAFASILTVAVVLLVRVSLR